MTERPDIILLTVDALRFDHLSCYGYRRETPTFDRFAEGWIDAPTTVSASSHTREAMPPLLTGHSPEEFHETGFSQLPEGETLAGKLSAAGYRTGGFHSNPYLSRAYDFHRGFDEFFDDLVLGQNRVLALAQKALDKFVFNKGEYYARAPEINRRALDWLDERDDPSFLWNHYMDVHGPYHAPETRYASRELSASEAESLYRRSWKRPESITDEERRLLIDGYDDEIRFLDGEIGTFLDEIRRRDRFEDALVVVTADHGDAFGEHGYYTHPRRLHEELLRVPLFVSPPGGMAGTVDEPTSTLDVVPTLLSAAGVAHDQLPGTPLVTPDGEIPGREGVAFASATGEGEHEGTRRFAVRDERRKVRIDRDIESGEVLDRWALDTSTEREERTPVAIDGDDRTVDLRERLLAYSRERLSATANEAQSTETTGEIDERLEALGYK